MNVTEATDLLKNSELKQLSVKDDKNAVRGFINMGILELYKRFCLWQDEALITMVDGTSSYSLDGTDVNVSIDLSDKDFLVIDCAYDYNGNELVLNDENDTFSVTTPKYNTVEIPVVENGEKISIIWRAAPKFLTADTDSIPLPPQFNEALFNYVGFRAYKSVKGEASIDTKNHSDRFEKSVLEIKRNGLFNEDSIRSHKFIARGFV